MLFQLGMKYLLLIQNYFKYIQGISIWGWDLIQIYPNDLLVEFEYLLLQIKLDGLFGALEHLFVWIWSDGLLGNLNVVVWDIVDRPCYFLAWWILIVSFFLRLRIDILKRFNSLSGLSKDVILRRSNGLSRPFEICSFKDSQWYIGAFQKMVFQGGPMIFLKYDPLIKD